MAKLKIKAREMTDAEVEYISLVNRGANRTPFKVVKAHDQNHKGGGSMIDLAKKILGAKEKAPQAPEIVAVTIRKADGWCKLAKAVEDAGFKGEREEQEGLVMLTKEGEEHNEEDLVAIKLSDDLGIFLAHAKKMFDPFYESVSFADNLGTAGFFPGFQMGTEALFSTIRASLGGDVSKEDVRKNIGRALKEYSNFILKLAEDLPEVAFKLDGMTIAKAAALETSEDRASGEGQVLQGCPPGEELVDGKCVASSTPENPDQTQAVALEDGSPAPKEDPTDTVTKDDGLQAPKAEATADAGDGEIAVTDQGTQGGATDNAEGLGEILKKMDSLLEAVQTVKTESAAALEKLEQSTQAGLEKLEGRVSKAEQAAEAASKAVKGTVVVGSEVDSVEVSGIGNKAPAKRTKNGGTEVWKGSPLDKLFNVDLRE